LLRLRKETVKDLVAPARMAKAIGGGATAAICASGNDAGAGSITDPGAAGRTVSQIELVSGDQYAYVSTVWVKR
jgi:hypothetical protein